MHAKYIINLCSAVFGGRGMLPCFINYLPPSVAPHKLAACVVGERVGAGVNMDIENSMPIPPPKPFAQKWYSHLTSIFASTATDLAAYDSCMATHFNFSPCRSRAVGICTTDATAHVRGLSGSVAFVSGWSGDSSWLPVRENRKWVRMSGNGRAHTQVKLIYM